MNLYLITTTIKDEKWITHGGVYIINAKNRKDAEKELNVVKPKDESIFTMKVIKSTSKSKILFKQNVGVE